MGSNPIFPKRAYSLMVERTAHNGYRVGSNPARLTFLMNKFVSYFCLIEILSF